MTKEQYIQKLEEQFEDRYLVVDDDEFVELNFHNAPYEELENAITIDTKRKTIYIGCYGGKVKAKDLQVLGMVEEVEL